MTDTAGTRRITAPQLHRLALDTDVRIIDATVVLPSPEFDGDHRPASGRAQWRAGHLPCALHVDLLSAFGAPDPAVHFPVPTPGQIADLLARSGIGPGTEIVLYDNGGDIWAARLWWTLRSVGVAARLLPGGRDSWTAAGLPVQTGETTAPAPAPRADLVAIPGFWVDAAHVLDIVEGRRAGELICALEQAAYAGTRPTRYTRRGHIPGSRNVAARGSLNVTPDIPTEHTVIYCGGGISACLLAFAFAERGAPDVAVYSGSLEEWSAAPELALCTAPHGPACDSTNAATSVSC